MYVNGGLICSKLYMREEGKIIFAFLREDEPI
jgi:hypothetical protein